MNIKKIVYNILMFSPLVITLAALPFLPDKIPAHYGFDFRVTRWGSKYETLIFPAVTVTMGFFMLAMAKIAAPKDAQGKNNESGIVITGIAMLTLFNVMTGYFLYAAYKEVENLSSISLDFNRILFILFGIFLIVVGNLMPRLRKNLIIGLRTTWSLKNDITWEKSQRFGGISLIIAGAVMILICLFTGGWQCFAWSMGLLLVTVIIDIVYTYIIAKKY
ncbi:MAG TPA: DUF1648 domain-containing protein [Firmicutes bacterium]|nr:DUF1648 domain-containing protein [Bacillota bacterium]